MCGCMPGMSKLGTVMSRRHHHYLPLGVVLLTPDEQHQHQEGLAGTPLVTVRPLNPKRTESSEL